jgi:hypothetical protein
VEEVICSRREQRQRKANLSDQLRNRNSSFEWLDPTRPESNPLEMAVSCQTFLYSKISLNWASVTLELTKGDDYIVSKTSLIWNYLLYHPMLLVHQIVRATQNIKGTCFWKEDDDEMLSLQQKCLQMPRTRKFRKLINMRKCMHLSWDLKFRN